MRVLEKGTKLTLDAIVATANGFKFDLVGTANSATPSDTFIRLKKDGVVLCTNPVSVVVPGKIGTPHPTAQPPNDTVVGVNRALDANTSPRIKGQAANTVDLVTVYVHFLKIPVVDQFGDPIKDLYDGAPVTEGGVKLNQNLTDKGFYLDPVGKLLNFGGFTVGDPAIAAFLAGPVVPVPTTPALPFSFAVEVDGFLLNPAVVNRSFSSTTPNRVTITWP